MIHDVHLVACALSFDTWRQLNPVQHNGAGLVRFQSGEIPRPQRISKFDRRPFRRSKLDCTCRLRFAKEPEAGAIRGSKFTSSE